jgi:hypothetical protein
VLSQHRYAADVAADQALAKQIGFHGTPTFFVNGHLFSGARPIGEFRALIDEALGGPASHLGEDRNQPYVTAAANLAEQLRATGAARDERLPAVVSKLGQALTAARAAGKNDVEAARALERLLVDAGITSVAVTVTGERIQLERKR